MSVTSNQWILFLRDFADRKNIPYACALAQPEAKSLYATLKQKGFQTTYDSLYEKPKKEPKRIIPQVVTEGKNNLQSDYDKKLEENKIKKQKRFLNIMEKYTGSSDININDDFKNRLRLGIRSYEIDKNIDYEARLRKAGKSIRNKMKKSRNK